LARRLQPSADTPLLEPVAQHVLLTTVNGSGKTNGYSNGTEPIAALSEEYVAIPENETIASLVRPLVESVGAAGDIEPLIEASVEAVAIAVEGAIKTAEVVEQVGVVAGTVEEAPAIGLPDAQPAATLSAAVEEARAPDMPQATSVVEGPVAPARETVEAAAAVESTLAALCAAVEEARTPETAVAQPGVEVPVGTLNAAVEALALDILEATPLVEPLVATEEVPACETAETAPLVEMRAATLSAPVVEAPARETPETAPVVEGPVELLPARVVEVPAATLSAPVVEAPARETLETASVVEGPVDLLPPPVVEVPVVPPHAAVEETPTLEIPEVAAVVEPLVEVVADTVKEAPAIVAVVDSPLPEPTYDPAPLCHAFELHAETVLRVVDAQLEAFESGIRAIMAGFEAPPINALLAAPREIVKAPARPATQWKRRPRPSIPSVRPGDPNSSSLSAGPITSALAGPCLPADLRTLIEKKSSASGLSKKRGKIPAWPISVLVATGLFLGAGSLMQYLASRDAAVSSASQRPVQGTAATSVAAAVDPHPFARFVEVTGLRVSADLNRKSQMQYLVVNHSSARLSDVVLKIAVRSTADSSGAPPLFSLSVVVPSLAPYQSKEIKTDLDAGLRSTAIPDWENLRADVQVSTKQ
jgi:hypothetical protein